MPRFTNEPGLMSRATRRARSSRPSGASEVWILVLRLISGHLHYAVDVDSGGHDVLGVQAAGGDELGDLDDRVLGGRRHDGAEVAGRLAVDEVALAVGLERLDQRDVGVDGGFEDLPFAVQEAGFLALGQHGAIAGGSEESADAGAGGADPLG